MKKIWVALLFGIFSVSAWGDDMDKLEKILGVKAEEKLNVGFWMLKVAKMFTKDDPEAQAVLSGLRRVSISEYQMSDRVNHVKLQGWMSDMKKKQSRKGLTELVDMTSGDERVSIMAKVKGSQLINLSIITYEPGDEFVVIKLKGKIDIANIADLDHALGVDVGGLDAVSLN